eukprot:scaffold3459_cov119-Isochrysis_galbana.AAC.8
MVACTPTPQRAVATQGWGPRGLAWLRRRKEAQLSLVSAASASPRRVAGVKMKGRRMLELKLPYFLIMRGSGGESAGR